ncbi:MAG: YciI family protein [Parafilimonas sp.]
MPQFLILAEDYKDENALNRRLAIRETHLQRMREEKKAGRFIIGGAKLNDRKNMYGSMLILDLENENAVWKWLHVDPYFTAKVWEEIHIYPFKIADV